MRSRPIVFFLLLVCGIAVLLAWWSILETPRAAPAPAAAWCFLILSGMAFLALFLQGLRLNARAQRKHLAAARPVISDGAGVAPPATVPDPAMSGRVARMLAVPAAGRDAEWQSAFLEAIPTAPIYPAEPADQMGPDHMPYAMFRLADEQAPVTLSLAGLAEALTERGVGAVLNPRADGTADWVFSGGDLLSLRLYGKIAAGPPPDLQGKAGDKILAASPSPSLLPASARAALGAFMRERLGVAQPAVFLIVDAAAHPPESLVLNLFPAELPPGWTMQGALRYAGWFLPRHYRAITIPKEAALCGHFRPL